MGDERVNLWQEIVERSLFSGHDSFLGQKRIIDERKDGYLRVSAEPLGTGWSLFGKNLDDQKLISIDRNLHTYTHVHYTRTNGFQLEVRAGAYEIANKLHANVRKSSTNIPVDTSGSIMKANDQTNQRKTQM